MVYFIPIERIFEGKEGVFINTIVGSRLMKESDKKRFEIIYKEYTNEDLPITIHVKRCKKSFDFIIVDGSTKSDLIKNTSQFIENTLFVLKHEKDRRLTKYLYFFSRFNSNKNCVIVDFVIEG